MHTARATHLRRHSNSSSDDSHAGIAPATDGMVTLRALSKTGAGVDRGCFPGRLCAASAAEALRGAFAFALARDGCPLAPHMPAAIPHG